MSRSKTPASKASRRQFVKTTAALGAGYWIADRAAAASKSPNEGVAFACIGVDGKGHEDSNDAGRLGDVVAFCEIDANRLAAATKRFPKAKTFNDFRKLFDTMHKSIDAATVSTPDHIHAPAAAMAMRHGKHCFVQKPLTHNISEARVLAKLARDNKLATQMGNQGSALSTLRKAAALLKAGVLGAVSEIHISTDRPIWPQGIDRPAPSPPPAKLDWDLWLGPAPARPYGELTDSARGKYPKTCYHPFAWRGWWDFGTGALGDIACHAMNMAFHGLDLRDPVTIQAETSGHNRDSFPSWSIITYEFAATTARPAVKLFWYDGGKLPNRDLFDGFKGRSRGCLVIGAKGKMIFGENGHRLTDGVTEPNVSFAKSPGHFDEWVEAIRGGEPCYSNIPEFAGPLTEMVLAGNLAVWAANTPGQGPKIEWDAANMRVKNHEGMETLVKREYRKGYEV
jgi:predicted dehydrogenase